MDDVQTNNNQISGLVEIDLKRVFKLCLKYWYVIVLCTTIGCGIGYCYQKFFVKNLYKSEASFFVTDTTTSISLSDFTLGSELAEDYIYILKNSDTLNEVIRNLNLQMTYEELSAILSFTINNNSHIVLVSATTTDPELSKKIANEEVIVGKNRIRSIINGSDITIVALANDQTTKQISNMQKYLGYSAIIGLLFSLILLAIAGYKNRTLTTEANISEMLNLSVLGNIPFMDKKNLLLEEMRFLEHEAFNTLCSNINLSGYRVKTIAFTSALPDEGKSVTAYLTAKNLTEFKKRVVFIDGDMRNSSFSQLFGLKTYCGLSDFLTDDVDVKDIIHHTTNPLFDFVLCGKNPPNPSAVLTLERFNLLLQELSLLYDYVIIDTPPVLSVVDGVTISKACDGCLLVVETNKSNADNTLKIKHDLKKADVNILGVVMNKTPKKNMIYGKYGKYGKYENNTKVKKNQFHPFEDVL